MSVVFFVIGSLIVTQNVWEPSSGFFTAVFQCGIFMRRKRIVLNGEIGRKSITPSQSMPMKFEWSPNKAMRNIEKHYEQQHAK